MNSSDSNYINDLNNATTYIFKYIVPLFYIAGNIGNLISALIFSKKTWKKNVCVFYFKMYLLFSSLYINCTIFTSIFIFGNNIRAQNSSVFLCKIYFYVSFLFATISPSLLILASIDRLLISSQNVDTRLYSSKRLAYFSISIIIFFWTFLNCHLLFKVNIQELYPSVFVCYYDPSEIYRDFLTYSLLVIKIIFYLLMFILSIFAFKNVRHIRIVPRRQRTEIRSMTKKDFQVLRCLFAQDIVFIACCLWTNIYNVYSTITKDQIRTTREQATNTFLESFFTFIYNASYCTSFFIYVSISKTFRQELKRMIYKMFAKNLMVLREEENKRENVELNVVVVSTIVTKT